MQILTTTVPVWVSLLFLITILIPVFQIASLVGKSYAFEKAKKEKIKRMYLTVLLFYMFYFLVVSIAGVTGFFSVNSLPPKIVIYTILPLFLFYIFFVTNSNMYKTVLSNIPITALIQIHLFRFIGIFFLIANAYEAIPTKFAYIAGLGDIITALIAIIVINAVKKQKPHAKTLAIAWNIFGLLDIISVLVAAISTTKQAIETGSQDVLAMASFPFCLIPAFAPATIIFFHILIFKKIQLQKIS